MNKSEFKEDVMFYKAKFLKDFKKIDQKYDYFYRPYEQDSREDQEYFEIERQQAAALLKAKQIRSLRIQAIKELAGKEARVDLAKEIERKFRKRGRREEQQKSDQERHRVPQYHTLQKAEEEEKLRKYLLEKERKDNL